MARVKVLPRPPIQPKPFVLKCGSGSHSAPVAPDDPSTNCCNAELAAVKHVSWAVVVIFYGRIASRLLTGDFADLGEDSCPLQAAAFEGMGVANPTLKRGRIFYK